MSPPAQDKSASPVSQAQCTERYGNHRRMIGAFVTVVIIGGGLITTLGIYAMDRANEAIDLTHEIHSTVEGSEGETREFRIYVRQTLSEMREDMKELKRKNGMRP